jgi:hypothetical protein
LQPLRTLLTDSQNADPNELLADRFKREQHISRLLAELLPLLRARIGGVGNVKREWLADLTEGEERERYLAEERERFNETAHAFNRARYAFPQGLLLRALGVDKAPNWWHGEPGDQPSS